VISEFEPDARRPSAPDALWFVELDRRGLNSEIVRLLCDFRIRT
jgi:hypothetical protein